MNKSIVPHQRTQYFYLPLEDDYIIAYETLAAQLDPIKEQEKRKLSGPSDCKAMIAATLERWMNNKRSTAKEEDDFYIYLTIDEWELYLRYRYRRSTIIHCLQEMEVEGTFVDHEGIHGEKGKVYRGTIKKCHYIQNTFAYQLNLPVLLFLLAQLPEQSPFQPKPRPSLGRPKNRLKINGINSDGISDEQNQEYPLRKNRIKLNRLILTDEQSKNKRYYGDEAASRQGLQDTIESTKITSNYIDSSVEDITTREGEDSFRRYDEGYTEEKRTSTFNDTPSQHIHNLPTPVDNSAPDTSSAILETGAPDTLPTVNQQPVHPNLPNQDGIESTTASLPIAIGPTNLVFPFTLLELDILCEDTPLPCFNGHPVQPAMATPDFTKSMATGNTSEAQYNGSDVSSTPSPVGGDIPSQLASPQDTGSGISSDAAVTTSNTDEHRDGVQGQDTSEGVQGSATELSTKETQEKAKDKILPEGAENSTVPPKKPKGKKLEDITALPKPERPPEKMVWGVPKCLLLATYYRSYPCPSKRCEEKAKHGAISLIQQGTTEQETESLLRYMKCLDKQADGSGIYDAWWEDKEVDIWHVAEHRAVKLRELERKKKEQSNGHHKGNNTVVQNFPGHQPGTSLPGGKPVKELTEEEIVALPPFQRKAVRSALKVYQDYEATLLEAPHA